MVVIIILKTSKISPQHLVEITHCFLHLSTLCCHDSDKIAIPDFGTGAMENWGLITYRENNLLYDEQESSSYNKQRVASVIAHELVHQVT